MELTKEKILINNIPVTPNSYNTDSKSTNQKHSYSVLVNSNETNKMEKNKHSLINSEEQPGSVSLVHPDPSIPLTRVVPLVPNVLNTTLHSQSSVVSSSPKEELKHTIKNNTDKVETPPNLVNTKSGDFDTLVLSGGSIHCMILLGSLQYCKDNFLLKKIINYVGTSAGAMCCYLLAIGYTPIEIMVYICTKRILEKMSNINLTSIIHGPNTGITSFSFVHEQLEKMTIDKIGRLITLKELHTYYEKNLTCITYNISMSKMERLNKETYPDMPCLIALRMSCNLPFVFDNFKYLGSFYIDGAVTNNFPIDIGDEIGNKILGLVLLKNINEPSNNAIEYIYQLMSISVNQNVITNIEKASDKCKIIHINPDENFFINFEIDVPTKLDMFSNGYAQIQKIFSLN
jgi:predicted acylesterase/phospholipase RssA